MPRPSITDILFDICYYKWLDEGVIILKELRPPANNEDLGTVGEEGEEIICTLYPHDPKKHPEVEQTLWHEMLHIGLDLDGIWDRRLCGKLYKEKDKKGATYWLEKYCYKRLTTQQKGILTELINGKKETE
jgi:hypothetical protein